VVVSPEDVPVASAPPSATEYDRVPYPSHSFKQSHPDRMHVVASVFGMHPAPVERCRVLELGCGSGVNLLSMAHRTPDSEFLGVDLAPSAVEQAREGARALDLANVRFLAADLSALPPDLGTFDYVVSHGVYSWVPRPVRDALLDACRRHLAPQGVAYVSYNAFPGGYMTEMVRQMLLFHVRAHEDPVERVQAAMGFAQFLAEVHRGTPDLYRQFLSNELDELVSRSASGVYHDTLAAVNEPSWFHEFAAHAGRHGLAYLSEADYFEMTSGFLPAPVLDVLSKFATDRLLAEQYLDFVKCRRFRQTLLCHASVEPVPARAEGVVRRFHVASPVRPAGGGEADLRPGERVAFEAPAGGKLHLEHPFAKAALVALGSVWPRTLSFDELVGAAHELSSEHVSADAVAEQVVPLENLLLRAYANAFVRLHALPVRGARAPGTHPSASEIARWQAATGLDLTSGDGSAIKVAEPLVRHVVTLLDGTRDREALVRDVNAYLATLPNGADDPPLPPPFDATSLDRALTEVHGLGLLEDPR
jgi:SAM-dependent methyltransferase/methyltransferase-like protein